MLDRFDVDRAGEDGAADPRLGQYTRCHAGGDDRGGVLLIGVAHDHPSSVARVAHLLDAVEPDVLALELPPLAVPLFRSYAGDEYVPPRLGGEMSTAIQAADDARTVGIDGPNATYLKLLCRRLIAERLPVRDLLDVGRDLLRGVGQALACRVGASVARLTPFTPKVYAHVAYDSASFDTPFAQAEHERNHVTERQSFLRVVGLPRVVTLIDAVREESMAERLTALRATDDVVAVVGIEHLDELSERLGDEAEAETETACEEAPISAE
jgi:pheromone shutdown protein TraB